MNNPTKIQTLLCEQWCAEAVVTTDSTGLRLSLPMYEADGDAVTVWLIPELGGWKITDLGTTLMRVSYDMDIDLLGAGQRAKVLEAIVRDSHITNEDGEFTMVVEEGELGSALLAFGQAVSRIGDIKLWNKARVANTFYDDLSNELIRIVGASNVIRDYTIPYLADAEDYPIDFYVKGGATPLYVFGVPSGDKAKLATIVLQRLASIGQRFESLVVPADWGAVPQRDMRRLMNAANEMVDSLTSRDALERKIRHRLAA